MPILFGDFKPTTEMKIPLRSDKCHPRSPPRKTTRILVGMLGNKECSFLQGGIDTCLQVCASMSWLHICKSAVQCHGLRLRSHIHVLYVEPVLVLLILLNARHYIFKISGSSDHEELMLKWFCDRKRPTKSSHNGICYTHECISVFHTLCLKRTGSFSSLDSLNYGFWLTNR